MSDLRTKVKSAINRLFNIDVREVSLVDNPAIDEPFTEVKKATGTEENKEDETMEKEELQKALQPLMDNMAGLSKRLDEMEKASGEKFEAIRKEVAESGTKTAESLKVLEAKVEETIVEAEKHFDAIDGVVFKAQGSQKIKGQEEGDKSVENKTAKKWPSLSRIGR
jgi:hypothetical protein